MPWRSAASRSCSSAGVAWWMPTGDPATVGRPYYAAAGEGEEAEEAHGRLAVAGDRQRAGGLGLGQRRAAVGDGERGAVVGGDDRVGVLELVLDDLEPAVGDRGAELALAEAQEHARVEALGARGIEERAEREDVGVEAHGRVGAGQRQARAPGAERVEHRRDLLPAGGELVDLGGGGRMFGLACGSPARRSVKRFGPSSSSRTVISAQRSPRMSSARAIPHASP